MFQIRVMAHARPAAYKNAIATFRVAVDGNMGICRWNSENKYIHKARKKKELTIYIGKGGTSFISYAE